MLASAATSPIVIAGAGLHGSALACSSSLRGEKPLAIDGLAAGAGASGKGGGFPPRLGFWPDDAAAQGLIRASRRISKRSRRQIVPSHPVLSVTPALSAATTDICPCMDGDIANSQWMDQDGGAQVAPLELCTKLMDAAVVNGAELRIGNVQGVEKSGDEDDNSVSGVKVDGEVVPCKAFVCTMGPWAALAQDWLGHPGADDGHGRARRSSRRRRRSSRLPSSAVRIIVSARILRSTQGTAVKCTYAALAALNMSRTTPTRGRVPSRRGACRPGAR